MTEYLDHDLSCRSEFIDGLIPVLRHVISGALFCGKTTLIGQLASQGFQTVPGGARLYLERQMASGRTADEIRENLAALQAGIVEM